MIINPLSSITTNRVEVAYKITSSMKNKPFVLDLGCGFGEAVRYFNERSIKTIGVDSCPHSIRECVRQDKNNKYLIGNALNIPFKPNTFDIVLFLDVIEHLPKGKEIKALKEINRVLKKGGMVILSTPNKGLLKFLDSQNLLRRVLKIIPEKLICQLYDNKKVNNIKKHYHRHYSKDEINALLRKAGFEIVGYKYKKIGFANIFSLIMPGKKFTKIRKIIHGFDYIFSIGKFSFVIIAIGVKK